MNQFSTPMKIIKLRMYIKERWILVTVAAEKSTLRPGYWDIKDYGQIHESLIVESLFKLE